jgi:hypothetical protein
MMIIDILIGTLIFAYAGWTLVKFIRKAKLGKCAACASNDTCQTGCGEVTIHNRKTFYEQYRSDHPLKKK